MYTLTAYVPVVLWASEWMLILLLETKVSLWSHEEGKSKTTLCTAQTQSTSGPKNSSGFTSFHSVYKAEPFITILVTSCAQLNEKEKNGLEHFKQNHHLLSFPLSRQLAPWNMKLLPRWKTPVLFPDGWYRYHLSKCGYIKTRQECSNYGLWEFVTFTSSAWLVFILNAMLFHRLSNIKSPKQFLQALFYFHRTECRFCHWVSLWENIKRQRLMVLQWQR